MAPGHCRECGCNSVPCPRCVDDAGVPVRYPMTDQARQVTHVGICPEHGAIAQRCASSTHYAMPADDGQVPARDARRDLVRGVTVALLVGFLAGGFFGVFAVAPAFLLR